MIVLSTFVYSEEQKLYDVTLKYDGKDIFEKSLYINYGYPDSDALQPRNAFRAEIKSFQGEKLYSYNFDFSLIIYSNPPEILDETRLRILLPYFSNAEKIEIYKQDKLIEEIDVSAYSDLELLEKYDPKLAKFIKKGEKPEWQKPKWLIIIGIIIVIGIIAVTLIKKRGNYGKKT